jgi:thioredoxin reductase
VTAGTFFVISRTSRVCEVFDREGGDPMLVDCAILGGGPAGLNAALVLGRARRHVVLFDDNRPRNAVTQESHGFVTRDGVKPAEFRAIAHQELDRYPSVELRHARVAEVRRQVDSFELLAENGEASRAKTVILATGLSEVLPAVEGIRNYYGTSLFCCPYCDGWERRDRPLVVISEGPRTFEFVRVVWNWSHDLLVCTNGHQVLTAEQRETLREKGIQVAEDPIAALVGAHGQLERVILASGEESRREGGFVALQLAQAAPFAEALGCEMNGAGGIVTDLLGRTTVSGTYAAGDAATVTPAQLVIAAAGGSRAAAGVNTDLTEREF